jgi:hypothetical protein
MYNNDAPELLPILDGLKVTSRELSGAGEYVNFASMSAISIGKQGRPGRIGNNVAAKVRGIDLGFLLSTFDDGSPSCLEIFSFGVADYPTDVSKFEIVRL